MNKNQKIRELIVYCENRGKTADLLAAIEHERPELYKKELKIEESETEELEERIEPDGLNSLSTQPTTQPSEKLDSFWDSLQQTYFGLPAWRWALVVSGTLIIFAVILYRDSGSTNLGEPTGEPEVTAIPDGLIETIEVNDVSEVDAEPQITSPENINGHEWLKIPAGPFTMGTSDNDPYADVSSPNEKPQHTVVIDTFWIARYETTNAQYKLFVDSGQSIRAPSCGWNEDGSIPENLLDHPVTCIDWYDAVAYTRWLSDQLGGYDATLPSEAEWEKAARGTLEPLVFPWGNEFTGGGANCYDDSCSKAGVEPSGALTYPVGSFPSGASPYDVEDMAGNVWEWTRSIKAEYPYVATDGRENMNAGNDVQRVIRGGSFYWDLEGIRVAYRQDQRPNFEVEETGFRVIVRESENS